jgi:hypothetical protein
MSDFSLAALGGRYRITLEESWKNERPEVRNPDRRWYEQIPTRCGGRIMLYSETPVILEYYTPTARPTATKVYEQFKDVPGVRLDTHFAGSESILYFPVHLFHTVAKQVGARRRRKLPEKSKEAFALGREKGLAVLQNLKNPLVQSNVTPQNGSDAP